MATARKIAHALTEQGLRGVFQAIEDNPQTPGEVVLWHGAGYPVYSVREAVELARKIDAAEDDEA